MAFSDARNEKARADTGRNATNHGGGAQRGGMNPQGPNVGGFNRYSQNPTPSYEATPANIGKVISRGMPGAGLIGGAIADIAGLRAGFDNPTGPGMGHDYDAKNMALQAQGGSGGNGAPTAVDAMRQKIFARLIEMNPQWRGVLQSQGYGGAIPTTPAQVAQRGPMKPPTSAPPPGMGPKYLAPGGPSPYGLMTPAYGWWQQP